MSTENYSSIQIWNSNLKKYVATPVNYYYSSAQIAGGNVSVAAGNTTVTGNNTTFITQLSRNDVLRNSENLYFGKVKDVISNTIVELYSNPTISAADTSFNFQKFNYTVIETDDRKGLGSLTSFASNSRVVGTGTSFTTQLDLGFQLFNYEAEPMNANLIGVVKTIHSDTEAELTAVSGFPGTVNFRFYPDDKNSAAKIFNAANNQINNALIAWGKSGLIQNLKQVKSHHPPVPDPVTGILVNFPATVHNSKQFANVLTISFNELKVDNKPNYQHSTEHYVVNDFNDEHKLVGAKTQQAVDSIPINRRLKKLALASADSDQFQINLISTFDTVYGNVSLVSPSYVVEQAPNGFVRNNQLSVAYPCFDAYQGPGGNVVYVKNSHTSFTSFNTVVDKLAAWGKTISPQRVINTAQDAKSYFTDITAQQLTAAEKVNLPARVDERSLDFDQRKQLTVTGIPAVVPGQLNAVLYDENPANRQFKKGRYRPITIESSFQFNKEIPVSILNPAPATD